MSSRLAHTNDFEDLQLRYRANAAAEHFEMSNKLDDLYAMVMMITAAVYLTLTLVLCLTIQRIRFRRKRAAKKKLSDHKSLSTVERSTPTTRLTRNSSSHGHSNGHTPRLDKIAEGGETRKDSPAYTVSPHIFVDRSHH